MTDRDHFAAAATDDQSDWLRHAVARGAIQIATLEAEIERLRDAIRRLADQDATLSVQGGNVTVTMDVTLTDEERGSVAWFSRFARPQNGPVIGRHAAALRGLLDRTK